MTKRSVRGEVRQRELASRAAAIAKEARLQEALKRGPVLTAPRGTPKDTSSNILKELGLGVTGPISDALEAFGHEDLAPERIPFKNLPIQQQVARGGGRLAGELASFLTGLKAVQATGIGTKVATKVAPKASPALQKLLTKTIEEGVAEGGVQALQTAGDPLATGLGVAGGVSGPLLGRLVTQRQARQAGTEFLEHVHKKMSDSELLDIITNERGHIKVDTPGKFAETVKKSGRTTEQLADLINRADDDILTNKVVVSEATDLIKNDPERAIAVMQGKPSALGNTIGLLRAKKLEQLALAADKAGDSIRSKELFEEAANLVADLSEKNIEAGRAIQVLSLWNRLEPQTVARLAHKQFDKAIRKDFPQLATKLDEATDAVTKGFRQIEGEAKQEIFKSKAAKAAKKGAEDPVTSLVKRIKSDYQKAPPEPRTEKDIINTLHSFAREFFTQKKPKPRNKMEFIDAVLKDREGYRKVFNKARDRVEREFSGSPEALEFFDDLFSISAGTPIPKKVLTSTVRSGLRSAKVSLAKLVRKSPSQVQESKDSIINNLLRDSKLADTDELELFLRNELDEVVETARLAELSKLEKVPKPKRTTSQMEKLQELVNLKASDELLQRKSSKVLAQALDELGVDLSDLLKNNPEMLDGSFRQVIKKILMQVEGTKEQKEILAKALKSEFEELVTKKKSQLLRRLLPDKKVSPQKLALEDRLIQVTNLDGLTHGAIKNKLAERFGLPSLTPELTEKITKKAQSIKGLTGREREVAVAEMMKLISDEMPVKTSSKWAQALRMSQLIAAKTFGRNMIGNTLMSLAEQVSDVVAVPVDIAVTKVRQALGQQAVRTSALPNFWVQIKGFMRGLKMGAEDVRKGIDTFSPGTKAAKFDLPQTQVFRNGVMSHLEKVMGYSLRVTDRGFFQAAFDGSIDQQLRLASKQAGKQITEVTEDMILEATHKGLYRTFQDDTVLSQFAVGLKKLLNVPTAKISPEFGAGNILLNYAKTPANLLNRGFDYSPLGYTKFLFEATRPLVGKVAKGAGGFNQKQFVDSFSRALVGTVGVYGLGYHLRKVGLLTAEPSENRELRKLAQEAGINPYSINMDGLMRYVMSGFDPKEAMYQDGDEFSSYDWAQPLAISMAMGANYADKEGGDIAKGDLAWTTAVSAFDAAFSGIDTLFDQPLMQGLSRFRYADDSQKAATIFTELAVNAFIPQMLRQSAKADDPIIRERHDPDLPDRIINNIMASTPGLTQFLPEKKSIFGQSIDISEGKSHLRHLYDVFVNPAITRKLKLTPEVKELFKLHGATGRSDIIPKDVGKKQIFSGIKVELDAEMKSRLQEASGKMIYDLLTKRVSDPLFMRMDAETKADIISKDVGFVARYTRLHVLEDNFMKLAPNAAKKARIQKSLIDVNRQAAAERLIEMYDKSPNKQAFMNSLKAKDKNMYKRVRKKQLQMLMNLSADDREIKGMSAETQRLFVEITLEQLEPRQRIIFLENLKKKQLLKKNFGKR